MISTIEGQLERNDTKILNVNEESAIEKTVRLVVNLLTNILIVLTVFVCLLYSCTSTKLNVFQLHIVLCVLGYQFCMCQGTLVLSKYNSWSMYMPRRYRRHLHLILQLAGCILVTVGSILMMKEKYDNFDTAHGIVGLCALIASLLGLCNGLLALYAYKMSSFCNVKCIRFIHYGTGIATLLLSATCLCLGFDKVAFRGWAGNEDSNILIVFTCIFTILVALDFWLATGKRIRSCI